MLDHKLLDRSDLPLGHPGDDSSCRVPRAWTAGHCHSLNCLSGWVIILHSRGGGRTTRCLVPLSCPVFLLEFLGCSSDSIDFHGIFKDSYFKDVLLLITSWLFISKRALNLPSINYQYKIFFSLKL